MNKQQLIRHAIRCYRFTNKLGVRKVDKRCIRRAANIMAAALNEQSGGLKMDLFRGKHGMYWLTSTSPWCLTTRGYKDLKRIHDRAEGVIKSGKEAV